MFSWPRQFKPLELEPGVTPYQADHSCPESHHNAFVDTSSKALNVAGWVLGSVVQLNEVHDRGNCLNRTNADLIDVESNQLTAREKWSSIIGVAEIDSRHCEIYASFIHDNSQEKSVKAKLKLFKSELLEESLELHEQFLGTLLMSGSDEGTESVLFGSIAKAGNLNPFTRRMAQTCHTRRFFTFLELKLEKNLPPLSINFELCPSDTRVGDGVA
ncbi:hypothetical protein QBC38DRAFT_491628 [Podospora fimiseda]|uniref:Uncharacterized protein n=1 Tax=Podospora fimiseda TaxID=252190 RepID=A0AAN6YNK9_9PEZI|nr:hypothetical protein QBC38DRAFT_491628 [Podospora fimiseda]